MALTKANRTFIFSQFLHGDTEAYRIIYTHYYERLCIYLYSFTRDRTLAEDMAQDTLLMLWKKRLALKDPESLNAFLYRSAYNLYIDHYRRQKFVDRELEDFRRETLNEMMGEESGVFESRLRRVKKAIEGLPPRCREIFELSKKNGLSYKEIASRFDISPKTVENQIGKALKQIRKQVKDNLYTLLFFCTRTLSRVLLNKQ